MYNFNGAIIEWERASTIKFHVMLDSFFFSRAELNEIKNRWVNSGCETFVKLNSSASAAQLY